MGLESRDQSDAAATYRDALRLLLGGLGRLESEGVSLIESLRQAEITVDRQIVLTQLRDNTTLVVVARYEMACQNLREDLNVIPSDFTRISDTISQEFFYAS